MKPSKILTLIAVVVLVLVGGGVSLAAKFDSSYPIIFTIIATGVVSFFGILAHQLKTNADSGISDSNMRIAVTASLTISCLVFVGYTAYLDPTEEVSEMAKTAVTSFTTIVGTVMVFYFGSSAYLQAKSAGRPRGPKENSSDQAT